jgi:hypothetical protein
MVGLSRKSSLANKAPQPMPIGAGMSVPRSGTGHVTGPAMEQSRTQRDTAGWNNNDAAPLRGCSRMLWLSFGLTAFTS